MAISQYEPFRPPPHKTKAFRVLTERELRLLERLCVIQCTYGDICQVLRMSKATLVRMRKDDPRVLRAMQKGYALGRMKLREAMFKKAQYDDRIMKFLAKHFLGYSDFRRKVPADKAEDAWSETEEMSMPEPIIPPDLVSEWARLRKLGEEYDNLWSGCSSR